MKVIFSVNAKCYEIGQKMRKVGEDPRVEGKGGTRGIRPPNHAEASTPGSVVEREDFHYTERACGCGIM